MTTQETIKQDIEKLEQVFDGLLSAQPMHRHERVYQVPFKVPAILDVEDPRFIDFDLNEEEIDEDILDELYPTGTELMVEIVLIYRNDDDRKPSEVFDAHFEINYEEERIYAVLEKRDPQTGDKTFHNFEMDSPFWDYLELIYNERDPVELLIDELNQSMPSGFERYEKMNTV